MAHRLAVVILHYGSVALTQRLHRQLQTSDPRWADLFVVDNAAPEPYPDAWVRLPENNYWAGGLQAVAAMVREQGFTHLWFLNNDIRFTRRPPILATAWQRFKRLDATIGPVGVYSPGATSNPYHPHMVQDESFQYRTVAYVDGIAPLISLDCLDAIGGVDLSGNPYGYGVDVILSMTAHHAGWPVVVDHQVGIKHAYHSTARTIDGFMEKAALAEDAYMRSRLGPQWRAELDAAKHAFSDHYTM